MRALPIIALCVLGVVLAAAGNAKANPLLVATTTQDLASIVQAVGGDDIEVTVFARGGQDPHFVEPRPSFIKVLSRSDLFVMIGLQLEIGWVPPLLRSARNSRIRPGGAGHLDASDGIPRIGVQAGTVDRSSGDVHAQGNPHYLTDPVNGMRVARAVRDRLVALRPEQADAFRARASHFESDVIERLVGRAAVTAHGLDLVAAAAIEDRIAEVVSESTLGGWLGAMKPHAGKAVVADHNLWPYFTQRFGLRVAAFLEPFPGIAPTTRHLAEVAEQMRSEKIRVVLSAAYFHPRYATKVASATGATVVEMADQVGAREGVDDYIAMIDWNVRALAGAL